MKELRKAVTWKVYNRKTRRTVHEQRVLIPVPGDVMRAPSGLLRIVRAVHVNAISQGLRRVHIAFVIRHCSWTRRSITFYSYGELLCQGYRLTRGKVPLNLESDKIIAADCESSEDRLLTCCDVRGIP